MGREESLLYPHKAYNSTQKSKRNLRLLRQSELNQEQTIEATRTFPGDAELTSIQLHAHTAISESHDTSTRIKPTCTFRYSVTTEFRFILASKSTLLRDVYDPRRTTIHGPDPQTHSITISTRASCLHFKRQEPLDRTCTKSPSLRGAAPPTATESSHSRIPSVLSIWGHIVKPHFCDLDSRPWV